jgi:hypothetical protein
MQIFYEVWCYLFPLHYCMSRVVQYCVDEVSSFHGYKNSDCGLLGYDIV